MAGGHHRAGKQREALRGPQAQATASGSSRGGGRGHGRPCRGPPPGEEEKESLAGAHQQCMRLLAGHRLPSTGCNVGDCLIMAHYEQQAPFCKVVTTGEGYNYYNEASPAQTRSPPISPKCHCSNPCPCLPPGLLPCPPPHGHGDGGAQGTVLSVAFSHQRSLSPFFFSR